MRVFTVLHILISLCSCQSISCNNASQCVGDYIIQTAADQVMGYGYKSISSRQTSITHNGNGFILCYGAFSCDAASFIHASSLGVLCGGSNSCRNVSGSDSSINSGFGIDCGGSNSCMHSSLRSKFINCYGDQSCAYSHIDNATYVRGYGSYSLIYSVITSPDSSVVLNVYLYGYNAGFGAKITCQSTDSCIIYCYGNACYMTYIECKGVNGNNCIITNISNPVFAEPIFNIQQFNAELFHLLYNSETLTIENERTCNEQQNSITYDNFVEHSQGSDIVIDETNQGSICCRGTSACYSVTNIQIRTTTDDVIVCGGYHSCDTFNANMLINNMYGPIFCDAESACDRTNIITTNNVYCTGRTSCSFSNVSQTHNVFCAGAESCSNAIVKSSGVLNVYLLGYNSGLNTQVHCNGNDICSIVCGAKTACSTIQLYGNVIIRYTPRTTAPSQSPSKSPTKTLSYDPNISPTKAPNKMASYSPTTVKLFNYCAYIKLSITNWGGLTSDDVNHDHQLQVLITNITKYGITNAVQSYGTLPFYIEFKQASGDINITETICTLNENTLTFISNIIVDETRNISDYIKHKIMVYFIDDDTISTDNISVLLYIQTELKKNIMESSYIEDYILFIVNGGIIGLFVLCFIASFIDAKCLRQNDFYEGIDGIILPLFQVLDLVSDILFAVTLTNQYINGTHNYILPMILTYCFIVIPIVSSLCQLLYAIHKYWILNDEIKVWLSQYSNILYLSTILTGSSFTAIQIVNSNAFKLHRLRMGLNKKEKAKYATHRIYSIVMLENIPQLAIQIWYLMEIQIDLIAIFSIIYAFISIIMIILTICTQKSIIKNEEYLCITFDIKGNGIKSSHATKINEIKRGMAGLLLINKELIDIMYPKGNVNGFNFEIYLYLNVNSTVYRHKNYEKQIRDSILNGEFVEIMKTGWNLSEAPLEITNVKFETIKPKKQSKNDHDHTILDYDENIQLTNNYKPQRHTL